jgi:hypothetical protein
MTEDEAVAAAELIDKLAGRRSLTRAELGQAAGAADTVAKFARDLGAGLARTNHGRDAAGCAELAKRADTIAQRVGVLLAKFGGAGDVGVTSGLPNPLVERGAGVTPTSETSLDPAAVRRAYKTYWKDQP